MMTFAEFTACAARLPYLFMDDCHVAIDEFYDLDHDLTDEEQEEYDFFYDMLAGASKVSLADRALYVGYLDDDGQWCDPWDD